MIYDNLQNVRVLRGTIRHQVGFSLFGPVMQEVYTNNNNWTAIYNSKFSKWIVTNDLNQHGLKATADDIQVIGFADNIDAIMFVVWEHQKSFGLERTVFEEIKDLKNQATLIDESEWNWVDSSNCSFPSV